MSESYRAVVRSSRAGRITVDTVKLRPKKTLERAQADRDAQVKSLQAQGFVKGEHGLFWRGQEWAKVEIRDSFWNRVLVTGEEK